MHGLTPDRRLKRDRRRKQIRRRRVIALVIVATLSLLAIWLAYALPGATPARVPAAAAQPTFADQAAVARRIVVATVGDVEMLLPVSLENTTAVGYHAAESPGTIGFEPRGTCASGGGLSETLADIFAGGGDLQYYRMGDGGSGPGATGALDVGAVPGAEVFSPVDGKIVGVHETEILGKCKDVELHIQVAADPTILLVVAHVAQLGVSLGDEVKRGSSLLGHVRPYPADVTQELSRYTSDAGDHVQFVALRVEPHISGL